MVECPHCKHKLKEGARFCSQCGEGLTDAAEPLNRRHKRSWLPIFTPMLFLVVMGVALYFVYAYEQEVNGEVEALKMKAEEAALSGEYREAETLLVEAIDRRPGVKALQEELANVQLAVGLNQKLEETAALIEEGKLTEADEQLASIQVKIQEEQSRLLVTLLPTMSQIESKMTLQEINKELSKLTDIDELAAKLNTLSGLNLEEASKVTDKITEKIVNQSMKNAEEAVNDKRYTEAVAFVDQGLQYVSNDEKLTQLKERIQQEQQAFEQAEQQRLEMAMQQAAEDELINQTEALKILNLEISKDEFGDYKVSGEVESMATQIISTVTVKYDILAGNGEAVRSESAKVYPLYLNPGNKGTFETMYYELEKDDYSVEMTEMEWLVE